MTRLSISEGQPFTYELINQIIDKVNSIDDIQQNISQQIEVDAPGSTGNNIIKIVTGKKNFSVEANKISADVDVQFNSKNFTTDPIVIACLEDPSQQDTNIQMAVLMIRKPSKTGFSGRVQIIKKEKNTSQYTLHYIAIGLGPRISDS